MTFNAHAGEESSLFKSEEARLRYDIELDSEPDPARNWSIQVGVARITKSKIEGVLTGHIVPAEGDAGGQLYSVTVNWVAHRFEVPFYRHVLTPQFEPYARLTLVDEKGSSIFPDYNAGVGFRWLDFPWNKWIKTTVFVGAGLSYSSQVLTADRDEHPGEDRSHLKIDWPIEITFGLPRWPEHQIFIFNDHQSGGHLFDKGGLNSVGIGYRYEF